MCVLVYIEDVKNQGDGEYKTQRREERLINLTDGCALFLSHYILVRILFLFSFLPSLSLYLSCSTFLELVRLSTLRV